MAARILDGKILAAGIHAQVRSGVAALRSAGGPQPALRLLLVGQDPASVAYTRSKIKLCAELGLDGALIPLPASTTQTDLAGRIAALNADASVHGILLQLPLPAGLDAAALAAAIDPAKDVDGLHPLQVGRLWQGSDEGFVPCTPLGIIELIRASGLALSGKRAVIVGRSNLVGKPTAALLLREHCTVTLAHSRTRDLAAVCREADILVSAAGRAGLISAAHVKPGAVVVDVAMNRGRDGALCGDVDFESVKAVAGWITPVPGGVGPLTLAMLMRNTLLAAQRAAGRI